MTIKTELDTLRSSLPGCLVVAFGDSFSRLILRSSHEKSIRREFLDELCGQAANCFDLLDATGPLGEVMAPGNGTANEAVVLTRTSTSVFVRSGDEASEFICLVASTPANTGAMMHAAKQTLLKIAPEQ